MYKKICLTIHPRNFGSDVSVARTLFRGGGGGNQVSARRGEEYVIFSWREIAHEMA